MKAVSLASTRVAPTANRRRLTGHLAGFVRRIFPPLLSAVIVIGLWECLTRYYAVPSFVLPAPSLIAVEMFDNARYLLTQLGWTALSALIGVTIATFIGLLAGSVVAISPLADRMLTPWLVIIHAVPKVVIAPLFLIWFGFGVQSEVLFVVTFTFFPVVVATITGLKSADPEMLQLVRSMNATRTQTLIKIMLPTALPSILSGIKLAISLAPVGAVIGEFVASNQGLGHLLIRAVGDMDTGLAFAAVVLFSVFGVLLWRAAEFVEGKLLPWHPSQRRRAPSN
jgi:NitT/TauT family transport system permease protein